MTVTFVYALAPRPEQVWAAHDGPITTLQKSPFFRDIILYQRYHSHCRRMDIAIWKERVTVLVVFLLFELNHVNH